MIWLSTLGFAQHIDPEILQVVALFFTLPALQEVFPPECKRFVPSEDVRRDALQGIVDSARKSIHQCPERRLTQSFGESKYTFNKCRRNAFNTSQDNVCHSVLESIAMQWPCEAPVKPTGPDTTAFDEYIDTRKAMQLFTRQFQTWHANGLLYGYMQDLDATVKTCRVEAPDDPVYTLDAPAWDPHQRQPFVSLDQVLGDFAPSVVTFERADMTELIAPARVQSSTTNLSGVLEKLRTQADSKYEKDYVENLNGSLIALRGCETVHRLVQSQSELQQALASYHEKCKQEVEEIYDKNLLIAANPCNGQTNLQNGHRVLSIVSSSGFWPRLSPALFLEQLRQTRWFNLDYNWKSALIEYGLAHTRLQRAERLLRASSSPKHLIRELQNTGHNNWDPYEYPESLLLELRMGS